MANRLPVKTRPWGHGTGIESNHSKTTYMKKILLGALVCAAVAGIVAYAINPEKVTGAIDDLKKKADDLLGRASDGLDTVRDQASSTMG
jgi:hypothetical protein